MPRAPQSPNLVLIPILDVGEPLFSWAPGRETVKKHMAQRSLPGLGGVHAPCTCDSGTSFGILESAVCSLLRPGVVTYRATPESVRPTPTDFSLLLSAFPINVRTCCALSAPGAGTQSYRRCDSVLKGLSPAGRLVRKAVRARWHRPSRDPATTGTGRRGPPGAQVAAWSSATVRPGPQLLPTRHMAWPGTTLPRAPAVLPARAPSFWGGMFGPVCL